MLGLNRQIVIRDTVHHDLIKFIKKVVSIEYVF